MPRTSKIMAISLSPTLSDKADQMARAENRTKSELFREALRYYINARRWEKIRQWGSITASDFEIEPQDIEKTIKSVRENNG